MKTTITVLAVLVVLVLGGWYIYHEHSYEADDNSGTNVSTPAPANNSNATSTGSTQSLSAIGKPASPGDITVDKPLVGDQVSSPVTVSGRAKGGWFFEATAPVAIIDTAGKIIGRGSVRAQGDWMAATGTVPFLGSITFVKGSVNTGAVVFMNDNPSGDPSRAKYLAVPVYFK